MIHGGEFAAIARNNPLAGGFQLRFKNGYTVSVMFGDGNYAAGNYSPEKGTTVSYTAEVAVFDRDGKCGDAAGRYGPAGWMTADDVARVIAAVSRRKG